MAHMSLLGVATFKPTSVLTGSCFGGNKQNSGFRGAEVLGWGYVQEAVKLRTVHKLFSCPTLILERFGSVPLQVHILFQNTTFRRPLYEFSRYTVLVSFPDHPKAKWSAKVNRIPWHLEHLRHLQIM